MKKIFLGFILILSAFFTLPVFAEEPLTTNPPTSTPPDTSNSTSTPQETPTLTDAMKGHIVEHCGEIRAQLKELQKSDSRIRVYLGDAYDQILTNYITPLNIRLVENNLSSASLIENQNSFAEVRAIFTKDFISYQQKLEELISMNCSATPENFYDTLLIVRARREIMSQDVLRLRSLISEHIKLANDLKGKL